MTCMLRSRSASAICSVAVALLFCGAAAFAQTPAKESKQPVRVLYVGGSGDDVDPARGDDFRRFLDNHFVTVKTSKDTAFTPAMAESVDVIVVDGDIGGRLPADFRRPMVLLGAGFGPIVGVAENRGYKLQNSCMVLTENLHTVRSDHPIFRGPLAVTPTLTDAKDPVTRRYVRAWKAHEPFTHPRAHRFFATGVTANATRLLGAEDSEIIAGGMNQYGDHAVALVREANLFHWGPAASPRHMTEEARRAFVNTVVYMKQFDGARPTVRRGVGPRSELPLTFNWITYESSRLGIEEHRKSTAEWLERAFSPELIRRFGYEVDRYRALDMGYLYVPQGTSGYLIDEEAKSLGIRNNDIRILEKSIELLARPAQRHKARRLLERYTRQSFPDARGWRQWFESNRAKLYFSDYYDYRFHTGPAAPPPPAREVQWAIWEMNIEEPETFTDPVKVGAVAVGYRLSERDARTMGSDGELVDLHHSDGAYVTDKGALVTLVVPIKIAAPHYTHASVPAGESYEPTKIEIELPEGARWHGEWQTPETFAGARPGAAPYQAHRGDAIFTRQLYFTRVPTEGRDLAGRALVTIRGVVRYQACYQAPDDTTECLSPREAPVETKLIVAER